MSYTHPVSRSLSTLTREIASGQEGSVDESERGIIGRKWLKLFFLAIGGGSAGMDAGMVGAGKI